MLMSCSLLQVTNDYIVSVLEETLGETWRCCVVLWGFIVKHYGCCNRLKVKQDSRHGLFSILLPVPYFLVVRAHTHPSRRGQFSSFTHRRKKSSAIIVCRKKVLVSPQNEMSSIKRASGKRPLPSELEENVLAEMCGWRVAVHHEILSPLLTKIHCWQKYLLIYFFYFLP